MTTNRKHLAYRHIPGALGTSSAIDHGAVVTEEYRLTASRDRRAAELQADATVQWVRTYEVDRV